MIRKTFIFGLLAMATVMLVGTPPAHAKTKTHKDNVRGFTFSIEDSFEQVPPKPGTDDAHVAAVYRDPSPKYSRYSGDQPTFSVIWTVRPKGDVADQPEPELPDWAKELPEDQQAQVLLMLKQGTKETLATEVDALMQRNARLFGAFKPFEERKAEREKEKRTKTIKNASKQELDVLEVNYHRKRPKDTDATWWVWVAYTEFETDTQIVELGFYGYVDVKFAKDFRKQFERTVKSFKLRELKETKIDKDAIHEVDPNDLEAVAQEEKVQKFIREKVIAGWSYERTPNYLVVYDDDVDKKIVNRVTKEIELLREQVYEVMFPSDRPIKAKCYVRICGNQKQYMAYGAPGGSAGYWSPYHEELVLYQDRNDKKDAIRVLYHEAFHQYIFYSVGEISPHSWFNEGHGDYFSGHVLKGSKFKCEPFGWRTETARKAKSAWEKGIYRFRGKRTDLAEGETTDDGSKQRLNLKEWLTWRQPQYYGGNDFTMSEGGTSPIPGGVNYALGWSFIYFLRETKNEEYQKILPRYFNALKSFVTQARDAALAEGGLDGGGGTPEGGGEGEPVGEGEGEKPPEGGEGEATAPKGTTTDVVERSEWHGRSLGEATQGLDLDQLEKDWLDHSW